MRRKAHTGPTAPLIKLSGDAICSAFGKWKRRINFWTLFMLLDLDLFCNPAWYCMTAFKNTASGLSVWISNGSLVRITASYTVRQEGTSLVVGIVHYFNYHTLYRLDWGILCPGPTSRGGTARWTRSSSSSTLSTCSVIIVKKFCQFLVIIAWIHVGFSTFLHINYWQKELQYSL